MPLLLFGPGNEGRICPICSKQDEFECQQKWEHILQYQRVGIYSVADGRTVAEFLDSTYLTHNQSTRTLYFKIVPHVGMFIIIAERLSVRHIIVQARRALMGP